MEKQVLDYCKDKYKWLFEKTSKRVVNGKRQFFRVQLTPRVVDAGSHFQIYREKNASPLILSKGIL